MHTPKTYVAHPLKYQALVNGGVVEMFMQNNEDLNGTFNFLHEGMSYPPIAARAINYRSTGGPMKKVFFQRVDIENAGEVPNDSFSVRVNSTLEVQKRGHEFFFLNGGEVTKLNSDVNQGCIETCLELLSALLEVKELKNALTKQPNEFVAQVLQKRIAELSANIERLSS